MCTIAAIFFFILSRTIKYFFGHPSFSFLHFRLLIFATFTVILFLYKIFCILEPKFLRIWNTFFFKSYESVISRFHKPRCILSRIHFFLYIDELIKWTKWIWVFGEYCWAIDNFWFIWNIGKYNFLIFVSSFLVWFLSCIFLNIKIRFQ